MVIAGVIPLNFWHGSGRLLYLLLLQNIVGIPKSGYHLSTDPQICRLVVIWPVELRRRWTIRLIYYSSFVGSWLFSPVSIQDAQGREHSLTVFVADTAENTIFACGRWHVQRQLIVN